MKRPSEGEPQGKRLIAEDYQLPRSSASRRRSCWEAFRDALEMAREQKNPVAMVAALRESAKISGYYAPERTKVEIGVEGERLQAQISAMSDAELFALAGVADGTDAPRNLPLRS